MSGGTSRFLAWQQLLRSANVFTAASNVLAGWLIVQRQWAPLPPLVLLVVASVLLYEAGMVLNDAMDAEVDAHERPDRPIPSGRVSRSAAFTVGWTLLAGGVAAGGAASWLIDDLTPLIVAIALAATVVAYDAQVKQTVAGPLALGVCRMLNVLLGASIAGIREIPSGAGLYAGAVGLYTVGFSLMAKYEADDAMGDDVASKLRDGEVLCVGAFLAIAAGPLLFANQLGRHMWWFVLSAPVCWWIVSATRAVVRDPQPTVMRRSVTRLILGFILLDAWITGMAAGPTAGLLVLALLLPALFASRKVAMT